MTESWLFDGIRILFATFDKAIYNLISTFYNVMLSLSQISLLSLEQIEVFSSKIYALLAVFMVFKITFSLINYLVNPEKFFDSSKGIQKILINIVIVLGMIIITPTAFEKLYEVQSAILADEVIPKFFMGGITTTNKIILSPVCGEDSGVVVPDDGDRFSLIIFRSFYQPDSEKHGVDSKTWLSEDAGFEYCKSNSVSKLLKTSVLNAAPGWWDDTYMVDYQILIATVVGVVVFLLIVSFCFDIAVRSIRLSFLQLIAPVPIVSYIDPDSSKNGMFKKWLKDVGKTWASLFIRLVSIYFAVYLISLISENFGTFKDINGNEIAYTGFFSPFWINVFMIIGILMFAKKLPSIIEGILGIKLDGSFNLNPMKKIRDNAILGNVAAGAVTGSVAAGGAFVAGGAANAYAAKKNLSKNWANMSAKEKFWGVTKGGLSTLGGATSSMFRTVANGKDGKFTPIKNIEKGVTSSSKARESRADGWGIVSNTRDRVAAMGQVKFSTGHSFERDNEIKELQMHLENYKRDENAASIGMSNIMSSNGGAKSSLYQEAFKNSVVKVDGMFKYQRATPNNYFDWARSKDFDAEAKWNEIREEFIRMGARDEELERYTRDSFDHYVAKEYGNSMLTRTEYENYGTLFDARNEADYQGRKTEKEIKKKQENKQDKKEK